MSYAAHTASSFVSSREHQALLAQLSESDDFRAELQANPSAVLARFGITLDPSEVPAKIALPNKKYLASAFDETSVDSNKITVWTGLIAD